MIKIIVNFLMNSMINHGVVKDRYDVYLYGMDLVVSSVICLLISLSAGFILKIPIETIIYLFCFLLLRLCSGGFHASTHLRCWLTMLILIAGLATMISYPCLSLFNITILSFLSIVIIAFFSPVENTNQTIINNLRKKLKFQSLVISIFLFCIALIVRDYYSTTITLHYVNITVALLILIEEVRK